MVLVSHRYKFIYIKNYKVAGTSVEAFFSQFCINPYSKYIYNVTHYQHRDAYGIIGSTGSNVENDKWYNHMNALKIRNNLGFNTFNNYIKFCVI